MEQTIEPKPLPAFQALENLRMRLLDLTARNRLINFCHSKAGSLRIVDELPNRLVERLLSDKELGFSVIPKPTEKELIDAGYLEDDSQKLISLRNGPTAEEWAGHLGFSTDYEMPVPDDAGGDTHRHTDKAIQALLYPDQLEERLQGLFRTSESAIQEMGANILYMAFGFLEWYESAASDSPRIAPLFLVPVRLHKGRLNKKTKIYEYRLRYSGEDIITNLSLCEKLRADFAMALPELDENTMPEDYFQKIQEMIEATQPRWRVRRYISLALLNFGRLLMYRDLDPARWPSDANIIDHPVVSRFLSDYGQETEAEDTSAKPAEFCEEYRIDEIDDVHDDYSLINDADSSQHSAMIDALNGRNLVIEGPPGTGKSQTIANLIAAAMAQGKKVLFVAEKQVALEVVRRRLDAVGLGEFCLKLHSHKSQKRKIIEEAGKRLAKHGLYRNPVSITAQIEWYENRKSALKAYAEKINQPWKQTGRTLHEIFTAATRYRNAICLDPATLRPEGYDGSNYNAITHQRNKDQIRAYRKIYTALTEQLDGSSPLRQHPWCGVRNIELQIFELARVAESLSVWQKSLQHLKTAWENLAETINCLAVEEDETISTLTDFLTELESIPALKGDEIIEALPVLRGVQLDNAQRYLQLFLEIQESYLSLAQQVGAEVLEDLSVVDRFLEGSEQFKHLVSNEVTLAQLAEEVNRLAVIRDQLVQLDEPLHGVLDALGEAAAQHLSVSESGLAEFKRVIDLIASLSPSYWNQRAAFFDNDELDELLPQLRRDVDQLRELHTSLNDVFLLDALPPASDLRQLQNTLERGGWLKWLKDDWLKACTTLMKFAANPRIKFSKLVSLLDKFVRFTEGRQKFEDNPRYRETLGDRFQGLDTDLAALEALRTWYTHVRKQYGIGFGQKVALGDAILKLDPGIAQGVRSLSAQGIPVQLNNLLADLCRLKVVFAPKAELSCTTTLLVGDNGIIDQLQAEATEAMCACKPLMDDGSLPVEDLLNRIRQMGLLKQNVQEWQNLNVDQKLFQGRLGLKTGINCDNEAGLSTLGNTLNLARHVTEQLNNQSLLRFIYLHPTHSTFESLAVHARSLREALLLQAASCEDFVTLVHMDWPGWTAQSGETVDNLIGRNQRALDNGEALKSWLDYVRAHDQMKALGLARLATSIEKNELSIEKIEDAYQAGIFDLLAREILSEDPELWSFSGKSQEALQESFIDVDNKLKHLQCEHIAWKIDQKKIPTGCRSARVSGLTEKNLLDHECSLQRPRTPIRQLLLRAGEALAALKPCFMMGPMSVAQYLEPGGIRFDLVVMDEASQIKPQDALGAIARGAQLVVVGDPKQLPPTNFFDRVVDQEEDDPTAIEVEESILDATRPVFPCRRLRWHYRSQHESLIAFSNNAFYESDLILFPSPYRQTEEYGVQYSRVQDGCFVNRRNIEEAKTIAGAVREHFRTHPGETLGVIAMSAGQRLQIERAIETLAKDDPAFQTWLEEDTGRSEALFVKNLENVQGDERDVIYISMTYGPHEPGGKVFQRFGPINHDNGWRRLNVLFTRARRRMHVFSSMGSDDIAAGPTSSRGVQALRDFLMYCETGRHSKTNVLSDLEAQSDFEIAVMEALRDRGFECVARVGIAGFFIDVAVLDPGNQDRYLMGIECDGPTYHCAKSTRDRDRLRQTILERLGWNIRRIWSPDWFKNPHGELESILNELHVLKSQKFDPEAGIKTDGAEGKKDISDDDEEVSRVDLVLPDDRSLKGTLVRFDPWAQCKQLPMGPENKGLLTPMSINEPWKDIPTGSVELFVPIPFFLRQVVLDLENNLQQNIFDSINCTPEDE